MSPFGFRPVVHVESAGAPDTFHSLRPGWSMPWAFSAIGVPTNVNAVEATILRAGSGWRRPSRSVPSAPGRTTVVGSGPSDAPGRVAIEVTLRFQ